MCVNPSQHARDVSSVRVYLRAVCKSYIVVSDDREWDKEKCGMVYTHGILFSHEEGWSYEREQL